MTDQSPAFIRTLIPLVVGYLATRFGFDPDDPTIATLVGLGVAYAYYVLCHVVELRWPAFGWLLGVAKAPAYSTEPAPSPDRGEALEAVVVDEEAGHFDLQLATFLGVAVLIILACYYLVRPVT